MPLFYRLAESLPVSDATVDKLLGANFLSLALIALVMVIAMFLLFVFMDYRRQIRDANREDVFMKAFTDEKSPMVTQQKRVGDLLEKMVDWEVKHDSKIDALTADIKERSELDGQAFKEHEGHIDERFDKVETKVEDIATIQKDIDAKLATIIAELQKRIDCVDLVNEVKSIRQEMRDKFATQPTNAVTTSTVTETTNVILHDDAGAALPKAS